MPDAVRRLLPDPGPTTVGEQLDELDLVAERHEDRPVRDHQLRDHARRQGDASRALGRDRQRHRHRDAGRPAHPGRRGDDRRRARCAPSATAASCADPEQARAGASGDGLPHDPLLVIVSGRLDLPWDAPAVHRRRRPGADLHRVRRRAAGDRDAGAGRPPRGPRRPRRGAAPTCAPSAASAPCSARAARACTPS